MIGMKSSILLAAALAAHIAEATTAVPTQDTDGLRHLRELEARVAGLATTYNLSSEQMWALLKEHEGDVDRLEAHMAETVARALSEEPEATQRLREMLTRPKAKESLFTTLRHNLECREPRGQEVDLRPPRREGTPWQLRKAGKRRTR